MMTKESVRQLLAWFEEHLQQTRESPRNLDAAPIGSF